MANFKLDSSHDLIIGRGATVVDGNSDEFIVQSVKCRILFMKDTWELDRKLGIPWIQEGLVHNADESLFQGIIYDTILRTEGVVQVSSLQLKTIDRVLYIRFRALTKNGTTINSEVSNGRSN
jgi:hypothetical protein